MSPMVVAVPKQLADKYPEWAGKIPRPVLKSLTVDEVGGRLRRAQARWDQAAGEGGDRDYRAALADAQTILAAPAASASAAPRRSALKAAGITSEVMEQHGKWISKIPDDVLFKLDSTRAVERAERAEALARQGREVDTPAVLAADPAVRFGEQLDKSASVAVARGVREDLARAYGRWIAHVPDDLLGRLDAAELADRCEYAQKLDDRIAGAPDSTTAQGYAELARQHLGSMPRAELEAEVDRLRTAALKSDAPTLTSGYLQKAAQLQHDNPQAPQVPRAHLTGKATGRPEVVEAVRSRAVRLVDGSVLTEDDIVDMVRAEFAVQGVRDFLAKADSPSSGLAQLERDVAALNAELAQMRVVGDQAVRPPHLTQTPAGVMARRLLDQCAAPVPVRWAAYVGRSGSAAVSRFPPPTLSYS